MKETQKNQAQNRNKLLEYIEKSIVILSGIIILILMSFNLPTWNNMIKIDLILTSIITIVITLIGINYFNSNNEH